MSGGDPVARPVEAVEGALDDRLPIVPVAGSGAGQGDMAAADRRGMRAIIFSPRSIARFKSRSNTACFWSSLIGHSSR